MNWNIVSLLRNYGRLGIRERKLANVALLGKLAWQIINERRKLLILMKERFIKLDMDESSGRNPWMIGFGGLLRNYKGRWLMGFTGIDVLVLIYFPNY